MGGLVDRHLVQHLVGRAGVVDFVEVHPVQLADRVRHSVLFVQEGGLVTAGRQKRSIRIPERDLHQLRTADLQCIPAAGGDVQRLPLEAAEIVGGQLGRHRAALVQQLDAAVLGDAGIHPQLGRAFLGFDGHRQGLVLRHQKAAFRRAGAAQVGEGEHRRRQRAGAQADHLFAADRRLAQGSDRLFGQRTPGRFGPAGDGGGQFFFRRTVPLCNEGKGGQFQQLPQGHQNKRDKQRHVCKAQQLQSEAGHAVHQELRFGLHREIHQHLVQQAGDGEASRDVQQAPAVVQRGRSQHQHHAEHQIALMHRMGQHKDAGGVETGQDHRAEAPPAGRQHRNRNGGGGEDHKEQRAPLLPAEEEEARVFVGPVGAQRGKQVARVHHRIGISPAGGRVFFNKIGQALLPAPERHGRKIHRQHGHHRAQHGAPDLAQAALPLQQRQQERKRQHGACNQRLRLDGQCEAVSKRAGQPAFLDQQPEAQHQPQREERIHLFPDAGIKPQRQVQRHTQAEQQPGAVAARFAAQHRDRRHQAALAQDHRQRQQYARQCGAALRSQGQHRLAHQLEHPQVARRVVGKIALGVKFAGRRLRHAQSPGGEGVLVIQITGCGRGCEQAQHKQPQHADPQQFPKIGAAFLQRLCVHRLAFLSYSFPLMSLAADGKATGSSGPSRKPLSAKEMPSSSQMMTWSLTVMFSTASACAI